MRGISAETNRRQALLKSAIQLIGASGSLDVSVKDIARDAGMSSALAFHYFGDKDSIIVETMRHLLREFSATTRKSLADAQTAEERVMAIIAASFAADQFDRNTIAAWLVLYLRAFTSKPAARLLDVYTSRLRSNLTHALREIATAQDAPIIADGLGSLIDGIYIRHALRKDGPNPTEAIILCNHYLSSALGSAGMRNQQMNVS